MSTLISNNVELEVQYITPYTTPWYGVINRLRIPPLPLWVVEEHLHLKVLQIKSKTYCLFHASSGTSAYLGLFLCNGGTLEMINEHTWNELDIMFRCMSMNERIHYLLNK